MIHYDPRRPWGDLAPHDRSRKHKHWERPPEGERTTFSDPGVRVFDEKSLTWILPLPEVSKDPPPPRASAIPRGDRSGVFWEVYDARLRTVMWVIEAVDFRAAVDEKNFLMDSSGWRRGWAKIRLARG